MKKAVIYARYSCDRQTEQSIEGQLRVCEKYAKDNDIIILRTYIDKAMTGTNDNRNDFQQMLADSNKKQWDYVLVYKLDRFSRNKFEMAIHRKHLKDNGIKLVSVMENIPDGPEGILLESLLEGMNQYYSEELSQKTKRGLNETRLKGNFIGGDVNYGYYREGQKLYVQDEEAAVLNDIFTDYSNGAKVIDIVRKLKANNIKMRSKDFKVSTLYHILRQEKYTGVYRVNGQEYDKIYPAIIPKELYAVVKKRIDANKHGKHIDNVKYLLKDKIRCGYCGQKIYSYTGTSASGEIMRYYKCRSIKIKTGCENKAIRKEPLENLVCEAIQKAFKKNKNLDKLIDDLVQDYNSNLSSDTALKLLETEYNSVTRSIANIINAIEQGISTESTKTRLEELEHKKHEIADQICEEKSKIKKPMTKDFIIKYFDKALKLSADKLIDILVDEILVYDGEIKIKFNYSNENSQATREFMNYTTTYKTINHSRKPKLIDKPINVSLSI